MREMWNLETVGIGQVDGVGLALVLLDTQEMVSQEVTETAELHLTVVLEAELKR